MVICNAKAEMPTFLCDLEIWQMTLKNNGAPLLHYVKFMQYFKAICEFKLELQSGNTQFGSKLVFVVPCDLEKQ